MRAVIDESANTISILWNVNAISKYDSFGEKELFEKNFKGWATTNPNILKTLAQSKFLQE